MITHVRANREIDQNRTNTIFVLVNNIIHISCYIKKQRLIAIREYEIILEIYLHYKKKMCISLNRYLRK